MLGFTVHVICIEENHLKVEQNFKYIDLNKLICCVCKES